MSSEPKKVLVKRTYVRMQSPTGLVPATPPSETVRVEKVGLCSASFYRFLYSEVGKHHHWTDRLPWSDEAIRAHVSRPEIMVWAMYEQGAPAGYFELEGHDDGSTEIAYFGLLPEFTGLGLGKYLLTKAVEEAWATHPNRVWLHTCTLDHPAALPNYIKRGFEPFKEETYETTLESWELEQGAWTRP